MDAPSIAAAMTRLLEAPTFAADLASQARHRHFPTWNSYSKQLLTWLEELRRRP
jgi:hypothetical protein